MAPPLEISIPSTSINTPADNNKTKPHTLYNITIRLPLRSFVVQKRYSDFAALHQALTSLVGTPPPSPLPGKSWFRSTVASPDLTEQRRAGLERYLRAVAEPPDRRWRDTPAWRAFLNLPAAAGGGGGGASASASGVSIEARVPAIGLRDANLAAASDPATWVDLNKEMKRELGVARAALARKEHATADGEVREAEAQARRALIKAGSLMGPLEEGLRVMKESGRLGGGEFTRRRDAVEAAKYEKGLLDQLAAALATRGGAGGSKEQGESDRAKLVGTRRPVGRTIGAPLPETEETRELDNAGVLQRQKVVTQEQDQRVGELGAVVHRLNQLGTAINDEVIYQNGLLDQANDAADSLGRKLGVANRRAKNL
ncbi:Phox domain-containing protein [Chaetomium fimeti]|uniref:Phox homologous domain-containing protein n=1 Tax=Chaetomium fimeti TaxID=1854472 RepID=A0AAE0HF65_9PEZI|nr:Phox homologous domain-containing protein [Chaetomium fimeti]